VRPFIGASSGPVLNRFISQAGTRISYGMSGTGPGLVLVHGGFSDHHTNWEFVEPLLRDRFTLYAIARRNRGGTDATQGHRLVDEAQDVVALMQHIGEPVFLLGHSYGAQVALVAARLAPEMVRKLVLYEAPCPSLLTPAALGRLEALATAQKWDEFAFTFFRDTLLVPVPDLEAVMATDIWPPIVADARASLGDLRALQAHPFDPADYRRLPMPVLLQIGSESPRDLYVTDALAAVLPHGRIDVLQGQAHEGMTTAPAMYARAVATFLLRESTSEPTGGSGPRTRPAQG
jgi:pimeloyl-ACP methyl ester carboxylesterase